MIKNLKRLLAAMVLMTTVFAQPFTIILNKGDVMLSGEKKVFATSFLSLQNDGNLILWAGSPEAKGNVIWKTQTPAGIGSYFLKMQGDGNLILRKGTPDSAGEVTWKTSTSSVVSDYAFVVSPANGLFIVRGGLNNANKTIVWGSKKYALQTGDVLENNTEFVSPFLGGKIKMQGDGNLVVRNANNSVVWSSKTVGQGCCLYIQEDGNMVIRDVVGNSIWASGTATPAPANNGVRLQTKFYLHLDINNNKPVLSVENVIKESSKMWVAGEKIKIVLTDLYEDYSFEYVTREILSLPQLSIPAFIPELLTVNDFLRVPGVADYSEQINYDYETGEEYLIRAGVSTIKGVEYLLGAGIIQFKGGYLPTLDAMSNFDSSILSQLNFTDCNIINASGLKQMKAENLTTLFIGYNPNLSDISFLENNSFKNLSYIDLDSCNVSDINVISKFKGVLNTFTIAYNNISDISILSLQRNTLSTLNISENNITDISILLNMPNLSYVNVRGNPLNAYAYNVVIPSLQSRGVSVFY